MTSRSEPPMGFEENPELGVDFFRKAVPAAEEARLVRLARSEAALRAALEAIVTADAEGRPIKGPIRDARGLLLEARSQGR